VGGGLILAVRGGTIAGMSRALRELLIRHVDVGTIPGGVALLGAGNAEVVTAGVASIGGGPMGEDAIMRIQSMTKGITSVAALRLVEAGRLKLDQNLAGWLPELADRQVLRGPTAELDDTVPARRAITLRHLLTNTCGYGMVIQASPLQQAMAANGTDAGPEPPAMGAEEWLGRLTELPLAFQPGEGWRYHHSFAVLGILISRVTGRPLGEHLAEDVFGPLRIPRCGWRRASWTGCRRLTGTVTRHSWRSSLPVAVSTQGRHRSTSATASSSPPQRTITASPGCLPKEDESTGNR
jgi:CubicO group peptidase (beta-lactamase class C family)